jgi:hypothetical protein
MFRCSGVGRWKACSEAQLRRYSYIARYHNVENLTIKKYIKKELFYLQQGIVKRILKKRYGGFNFCMRRKMESSMTA